LALVSRRALGGQQHAQGAVPMLQAASHVSARGCREAVVDQVTASRER